MTVVHAQLVHSPSIVSFQLLMALQTQNLVLDSALITAGVQTILKDPWLGHYFIAKSQDQTVSSLLVTREWDRIQGGECWWLQSVYVLKEFRKKGYFSSMLDKVVTQAKKQKVRSLKLYAQHDNFTAQNIYKSKGFRESQEQLLSLDLVYGKASLPQCADKLSFQEVESSNPLYQQIKVVQGKVQIGYILIFFEYSDWRNGLIIYIKQVAIPSQAFDLLSDFIHFLLKKKSQWKVVCVRGLLGASETVLKDGLLHAGLEESGYLVYQRQLEQQS